MFCLFVFFVSHRWTSFPLFPACAAILKTDLLKKSEIEKIKQVGVGSCRKLFVVPLIYLLQTEFKIANICLILFICPRRKLIFIHASKTFVNIFIVKDIPMQQRYQFKFQCPPMFCWHIFWAALYSSKETSYGAPKFLMFTILMFFERFIQR